MLLLRRLYLQTKQCEPALRRDKETTPLYRLGLPITKAFENILIKLRTSLAAGVLRVNLQKHQPCFSRTIFFRRSIKNKRDVRANLCLAFRLI